MPPSKKSKSITLNAEQLAEVEQKLAVLRHEVNNNLSLIVAAAEMIRRRPERGANYWDGLMEKPQRIAEDVSRFSRDLEQTLRLRR